MVNAMNIPCRKLLAVSMIVGFMLITMMVSSVITVTGQGTGQGIRTIRIIDSVTGNQSITLGNDTEPMPPGGYRFTVNVVLDGLTENLFFYQIAVSFNKTMVNCTAAWIPTKNTNFVFYNYKIVQGGPEFHNDLGYVFLGASLQKWTDAVTVSQGIFCQINFTAIKTGTFTLNIIQTPSATYPDDTFLMDPDLLGIPFTSESFSVTVLAFSSPPVASFTFNPTNPKVNQTVTFDASKSMDPDGTVTSYWWNFGDGNNATSTNATVTHAFALTGVYSVNLTVFDNDGLNNSIVHEILLGRPPYVNFTYDWERKDEYPLNPYANYTVTFNATESVDPDGDITLYAWNFSLLKPHAEETTVSYVTVESLNETATNATLNHNFTQNGIYHVKLTVFDNDGLHNSTAQTFFVGFQPIVNFTIVPENPMHDEEVLFNAYGTETERLSYDQDGHITYAVWDFGDLTVEAFNISLAGTELVTSYTYVGQGGVYSVNLTVFDDDGLYTSVTHDVNVTVTKGGGMEGESWQGYGIAGIVFVAIITVAVWYRRRPEKEPGRRERYRVI